MGIRKHSIMIIDSHPIVHDGIRSVLSLMNRLTIAASAYSSKQALSLLENIKPDLVITNLSLTDTNGCYLVQRISHGFPRVKILVYTSADEQLLGDRAATAGAHGYVMKEASTNILLKAIDNVLGGRFYFHPSILERLNKRKNGRGNTMISLLDNLSNREIDIFCMVGHGYDSHQISHKLSISCNTVDTHRINIKKKLDLPSGRALDRAAYEFVIQGKMPIDANVANRTNVGASIY